APLSRALLPTRAILERAVVHIPDVALDREFQHHALSRAVGFRSGLYVPMLREGAPIGVIVVNRAEAGPCSDSEIELWKTLRVQAGIAARMWGEPSGGRAVLRQRDRAVEDLRRPGRHRRGECAALQGAGGADGRVD